MEKNILSVSNLVSIIKGYLENNINLQGMAVRGEISNARFSPAGHLYFTLKDESSAIDCNIWKSSVQRLKFRPENGMKVIVSASVSVYNVTGKMSLTVTNMTVDGIGDLHVAFEQLKAKLEAEGLFDSLLKKPIPDFPNAVGVITSETGAVIRDIINVSKRRFEKPNIKLFSSPVQGADAAKKVIEGIREFNDLKNVDVIIIARGGGSIEDLWPFNDEALAREIFKSEIPIVSAVGHETDYTICDFVSDLRAPTPSAAAELVFPDMNQLKNNLDNMKIRVKNALINTVVNEQARLDYLQKALINSGKNIYTKNHNKLMILAEKLDALSPLKVLKRGYTMVKRDEAVICEAKALKLDDEIEVLFQDGKIKSKVIAEVGNE